MKTVSTSGIEEYIMDSKSIKSSIYILQSEIDAIYRLRSMEVFGPDEDEELLQSLKVAIKVMEDHIDEY